ncbi:D-sedoheptulose-7-phosphate isomerase [Roseateles cellulosilyticus]|uniref:Phosphoheptose isomerase n=1 Tax=Pelomonas cellulosilytica TaxID=2906762 RepID=A0ABS8XWB9_9BURK|nr:D-sedoheptulose 7-phosphate isomerase [Pelomonas sp. P8]MCE4555091.1 D-sedoheptulose 7-phosphate isomerase [Pelomonas sp. P8]
MSSLFLRNLDEHQQLMTRLHTLEPLVLAAGHRLATVLSGGGKIMFCGNGGSAADSQHLASELTGRFIKDRRPLAGLALTTDSSALTCIGNDYSFDDVFVRQVQGLGRAGDALIGISTSGNSGNVLKAVEAAKAMGIFTLGLLGRDGGKLGALCDASIVVPHAVTARIQEAHLLIGHTLCGLIEAEMGLGQ